jgi:hypothetical protein
MGSRVTTSGLQKLALVAFPPHFRARYGDELAAVVADDGGHARVTGDLLRSALREWVRPSFVGPADERHRSRLEATTATVWAWWCSGVVAVAIFARAVDDHPVPGLRSWGWTAYSVGSLTFEITSGLVAVGGFAYWLRVVRPAWRARARPILLRAVLPAPVVVIWFGGTGLVAIIGRRVGAGSHHTGMTYGPTTAGTWALLFAFAVFTLTCVAICSGSTIGALSRARLPVQPLRIATMIAAAVATGLGAVTLAAAVCLAKVMIVGGLDAVGTAMAVIPVAFLAVASTAAVTSAVRGLRAHTT